MLKLKLEPYPLTLATVWGTAHSSTTKRFNALVTLEINHPSLPDQKVLGYGEAGLPPKKKFCYVADYNDVLRYFVEYAKMVARHTPMQEKDLPWSYAAVASDADGKHVTIDLPAAESDKKCEEWKAFSILDDTIYGKAIESNLAVHSKMPHNVVLVVLQRLLSCIDSCPANEEEEHNAHGPNAQGPAYSRPARAAIEMCILDAMAKVMGLKLHELWGVKYDDIKQTYLTVSMKDTFAEMVAEAEVFLAVSHFIKIKMNKNIKLITEFLPALADLCKRKVPDAEKHVCWVIDANASWDPEYVQEITPLLAPFIKNDNKGFLVGIEQPFPAGFPRYYYDDVAVMATDALYKAWVRANKALVTAGLDVFADESCCDYTDLRYLEELVTGSNFKLEKTPGYRAALKAIHIMKETHKKVWIGMMVASMCGTAAHAHLLPLADLGGDVDGGLVLVDKSSDRFTDGVSLSAQPGKVGGILFADKPGLCLTAKRM